MKVTLTEERRTLIWTVGFLGPLQCEVLAVDVVAFFHWGKTLREAPGPPVLEGEFVEARFLHLPP